MQIEKRTVVKFLDFPNSKWIVNVFRFFIKLFDRVWQVFDLLIRTFYFMQILFESKYQIFRPLTDKSFDWNWGHGSLINPSKKFEWEKATWIGYSWSSITFVCYPWQVMFHKSFWIQFIITFSDGFHENHTKVVLALFLPIIIDLW